MQSEQKSTEKNIGVAPKVAPKVVLKSSNPCPAGHLRPGAGERTRWCEPCKHFIYDRAGLTDDQLISLIRFREEKSPTILLNGSRREVVLYQRSDGFIMSQQCSFLARRRSRDIFAALVLGLSLFYFISNAHFPARNNSQSNASAVASIQQEKTSMPALKATSATAGGSVVSPGLTALPDWQIEPPPDPSHLWWVGKMPEVSPYFGRPAREDEPICPR